MNIEDFEGIPQKVVPRTVRLKDPDLTSSDAIGWIVAGYCEKLIFENEAIIDRFREFEGKPLNSKFWEGFSLGQRILYSLSAFDGQVRNGGITQFFWNCPDLIFEASDAIKALNYPELSELYDKALEELVENQEEWFQLRNKSSLDPDNPHWEPFRESYDLLDLDWFNDAYYDKYDYDNQGKWSLQSPGLGTMLIKCLGDYVKSHKEEFIDY